MATTGDIKQAVHDRCVTALATYLGESESTIESQNGVRPQSRYDDGPLPAYTLESFESSVNRGIGSGIYLHNIVRDQNGFIDKLELRRTKERRFDIGAHASGDDTTTVDELYDQIEATFMALVEDGGRPNDQLHGDVETLRLGGVSDVSNPEDGVRGDRFRIDVEYHRYVDVVDVPTIQTVNVDLSVRDEDGNLVHFSDIQTT